MKKYWINANWKKKSDSTHQPEAGLLKLNCDKALFDLGWYPALSFEETVEFTVEWYKNFYEKQTVNFHEYCKAQIKQYTEIAASKDINWAVDD